MADELALVTPSEGALVALDGENDTDIATVRPPEEVLDNFRQMPAPLMDDHSMDYLHRFDPDTAAAKWEEMLEAAREELETGWQAAKAALPDNAVPMDRARFLVLREALAEEWQPRGMIEWSLIEQMAVAQTNMWVWTRRQANWLNHIESGQVLDLDAIARWMSPREREESRFLLAPRVSASEVLEQAAVMVDRWNRMPLRVLRQLRDLRRFSPPVIVNHGGQVNIAQQQVNTNAQPANFADDPI